MWVSSPFDPGWWGMVSATVCLGMRGPYNRGYIRACGFFRGYRDITGVHDSRDPKDPKLCFWIPAVLYPGHTPLFFSRDTLDCGYCKGPHQLPHQTTIYPRLDDPWNEGLVAASYLTRCEPWRVFFVQWSYLMYSDCLLGYCNLREPSVNRKACILVRPIRNNLVLDPLVVLHLNNRLSISPRDQLNSWTLNHETKK